MLIESKASSQEFCLHLGERIIGGLVALLSHADSLTARCKYTVKIIIWKKQCFLFIYLFYLFITILDA